MNSYELSLTAPSRQRVYRFHHLGKQIFSPPLLALDPLFLLPRPSRSYHFQPWLFEWQEWEDSNPRPAVLETAALPAELHSYRGLATNDFTTTPKIPSNENTRRQAQLLVDQSALARAMVTS